MMPVTACNTYIAGAAATLNFRARSWYVFIATALMIFNVLLTDVRFAPMSYFSVKRPQGEKTRKRATPRDLAFRDSASLRQQKAMGTGCYNN